jgi:hypothetical protein
MLGRTISHYRIMEKLGGGGMGVVYKVYKQVLELGIAFRYDAGQGDAMLFDYQKKPKWQDLPWWTKTALLIAPLAAALVILLRFFR